ncbi:MAG: DUF11 domain-containing protein [Erythrobacter sp.]|nr:DUF11 domain-containing protein [Erythrobacter sp.]
MLLSFVLVTGVVRAQTIENVASARWDYGGHSYSGQSNRVELQVDTSTPSILTYVRGSGSTLTYYPTRCGTGSAATVQSVQATAAVTIGAAETATIQAGRDLLFTVNLQAANLDHAATDTVDVVITTNSGDRERVTVSETGADTGLFTGSIPTIRMPPAATSGDCALSLQNGNTITIGALSHDGSTTVISTTIDVLADPFGVVFDSETGAAVNGATVTLVDIATGRPAQVFAEDGVTSWPSTVISGSPITDGAGNFIAMGAGEFWFPLVNLGSYRLVITPPSPYSAPSVVSPAQLALLSRPAGGSFVITDGSFGDPFTLSGPTPVQIDIPLDRPGEAVTLVKTASRAQAQPGDAIFYTLTLRNPAPDRARTHLTLTDTPSPWLRLRRDSIRIDGAPAAPDQVEISSDGSQLSFDIGSIPRGGERHITYAMTVAADAPPGHVENRAATVDALGRTSEAAASVEVLRDLIAGRMTIIGRITAGPCTVADEAARSGIPGVRVMMEDGSFAITDADGRYHFDGVVPGTHVVQASRMTLPEGGQFIDCTRSSRSQGSAITRLVTGQGGSLTVVDFHATLPERASANASEGSAALALASTSDGPGAAQLQNEEPGIDWLAYGDGETDWLAPTIDANPRAPSIRVAIRHRRGQTVNLLVDGEPVNPLAFEGTLSPARGRWQVSHWRGVSLSGSRTQLRAEVVSGAGAVVAELERDVFFTTIPARVELVPAQSNLVADGRTSPVVAIRVLDAAGRPMREGVSGEFRLNSPYQSAEEVNRQQLDQLTRRGPASSRWTVQGDDGIALIELAPTMVSGSLQLDFRFDDGEIVREQQLDGWIVPGDIEWTIIGLAEGTAGARSVADNMERTGHFESDLGEDARVALYAKGRVLGRFLLTLAYDSAAQEADARLLGTLDPNAYYSVFADGSSRQFDAASRENLYVRIETASFYALYGDFQTGFDQTRLTRYQRIATGVLAEAQLGQVQVRGFGAEFGTRFQRDEIQGQGISGPYRLSSRAIVPNSETVTIEVRDQFRPDIIVDSRTLTRFADYDIDVLSGTITFRQPVLSRDFDLNPQFIVIEYEIDGLGNGELNAGLRVEWESDDSSIRIGASAITDRGDGARTNIGGIDLRARVGTATEVRAELAASNSDGSTATGWLVEAQHQTGSLDLIAYARSTDADFGAGHQNGVDLGRRRVGVDSRVRLTEELSVLGSLWQDDSLTDAARRRAAEIELGYQTQQTDFRLGLAHFADRLPDGSTNSSTTIEGGVTQRMLDNKLELSASTSLALDAAESADLPTRHRLGARYAITNDVRLVGLYEIADGSGYTSSTLRGGFEVTPWLGGLATASLGKQDISELGTRSFAAFGLSQTFTVSAEFSLDATFDSNWTLSGAADPADLVNPLQPLSSGGQFGPGGELFEEFTAVTLGGAWRRDDWSATARGEYRNGEFANRVGFTAGLIRELGDGRMLGSGITWTRANGETGVQTEVLDAAIAWAHRPAESEFAFLSKLEYRSDEVRNAVAGEAGAAGRTTLMVDGDARSSRMIASISTNWSPREFDERGRSDDGLVDGLARRSEVGAFVGFRHNFDRFEGFDLASNTVLAGAEARVGIGERIEVGGNVTVRAELDGSASYSIGPTIGFVPTEGVLLTIGYNLTGFSDPDFSSTRNTSDGIYAAVRMKFDADTFGFLGLGR